MTAELEAYKHEFETLKVDTGELGAPSDDNQFNWRPAPKRWAVGQYPKHLKRFGPHRDLPIPTL